MLAKYFGELVSTIHAHLLLITDCCVQHAYTCTVWSSLDSQVSGEDTQYDSTLVRWLAMQWPLVTRFLKGPLAAHFVFTQIL